MRTATSILTEAIDRLEQRPPIHMLDTDTCQIRCGNAMVYINVQPGAELAGPYWHVWLARKLGVTARVIK